MHRTLASSHSLEVLLLGQRKDRCICGFTVCSNWKNVIFGFHRTQLPFRQCYPINYQDSSVVLNKCHEFLASLQQGFGHEHDYTKLHNLIIHDKLIRCSLHMHKVRGGWGSIVFAELSGHNCINSGNNSFIIFFKFKFVVHL